MKLDLRMTNDSGIDIPDEVTKLMGLAQKIATLLSEENGMDDILKMKACGLTLSAAALDLGMDLPTFLTLMADCYQFAGKSERITVQ